MSPECFAARGVTVFETNRGGKITYHGLGQLVGYPIVNLSPDREDVHAYVPTWKKVLIRTLQDFEIPAFRIEGLTWRATPRAKSCGYRRAHSPLDNDAWIRSKCEYHLSFFNLIIACDGEAGYFDGRPLGHEVEMGQVEIGSGLTLLRCLKESDE